MTSSPYTSYNMNVELRCRLVLYLIYSYNKPLITRFVGFLLSSHLHVLLRETTLYTKRIRIARTTARLLSMPYCIMVFHVVYLSTYQRTLVLYKYCTNNVIMPFRCQYTTYKDSVSITNKGFDTV